MIPIRKPIPRGHKRRTFAATITARAGAELTLEVARGCWIRRTDKTGGVLADERDPRAVWNANIGDAAIVCGPALTEIALVGVVGVIAVFGPTRYGVRLLRGEM